MSRPSTLTLVDVALTPEQAYMILDSLYETEGLFEAEATMDTINYIEARLIDAELPLSITEYQEEIKSPENHTYKAFDLWRENIDKENN